MCVILYQKSEEKVMFGAKHLSVAPASIRKTHPTLQLSKIFHLVWPENHVKTDRTSLK